AGLGHAIWCARHYTNGEPVAVLLADDLIQPDKGGMGCLKQMVEAWQKTGGNMVAAMNVPKEKTGSYGIITPGKSDGPLTEVHGLIEKPHPDEAPSTLAVVGRYILEPGVFDELEKMERGTGGEIQITDSLARRIGKEPFFSHQFSGTRFDCGSKLGFLQANISYALSRDDLADRLEQWLGNLNT
ncbi:MAG: UTP--glucose-1-phosphate uridylyltransferase, partial [Candidatus Puniceispirillales bacterium]